MLSKDKLFVSKKHIYYQLILFPLAFIFVLYLVHAMEEQNVDQEIVNMVGIILTLFVLSAFLYFASVPMSLAYRLLFANDKDIRREFNRGPAVFFIWKEYVFELREKFDDEAWEASRTKKMAE